MKPYAFLATSCCADWRTFLCKDLLSAATNPQTKKTYANDATRSSQSRETENATLPRFRRSTKACRSQNRKPQATERPKGNRDRRQFWYWPLHCARARPRGCGRVHQLCCRRRQSQGNGG